MPWFAAHAVLYHQTTDGPQDRFLVWENVLLIEADDPQEACARAEACAREDEGDDSGSLRINGRPATRVFGGLRKLITVSPSGAGDRPGSGDEVTYSEFEVTGKGALQRLIRGEEVTVIYAE